MYEDCTEYSCDVQSNTQLQEDTRQEIQTRNKAGLRLKNLHCPPRVLSMPRTSLTYQKWYSELPTWWKKEEFNEQKPPQTYQQTERDQVRNQPSGQYSAINFCLLVSTILIACQRSHTTLARTYAIKRNFSLFKRSNGWRILFAISCSATISNSACFHRCKLTNFQKEKKVNFIHLTMLIATLRIHSSIMRDS